MIESMSLETAVWLWVWGALLLALVVSIAKAKVLFDWQRLPESFLVWYGGTVALFVVSGGFLLTVVEVAKLISSLGGATGHVG